MRVLIACEYSGTVRRAFSALGHDVWSADFEPAEDGSKNHYQGDCFDLIDNQHFDLMIAHPPCTDIAVSGAKWFKEKIADGRQQAALDFVQRLMSAPIAKIAIENPISVISSKIRKPDQIIQPWMFGTPEFKSTCLWLNGLNKLIPTNILPQPKKGDNEWISWNRVHKCPPGPDRKKLRSWRYTNIAEAMAIQWGKK